MFLVLSFEANRLISIVPAQILEIQNQKFKTKNYFARL